MRRVYSRAPAPPFLGCVPVSIAILWRALGLQALAVALVFAVLVVAPLPQGFFADYGSVTGPGAWALCALVTGRLLRLQATAVVIAAVASGLIAVLIGVLVSHTAGLVLGVLVFGLCCATLGAPGKPARSAL